MNMGERIKQLRIQHDLTQDELGKLVGLKKSAIAKYEAGMVENMKRSTIQRMADVLNVEPSYLMCLDKPVTEKEKRRADLYSKAKLSDDPVLKALVDAIDRLLGID